MSDIVSLLNNVINWNCDRDCLSTLIGVIMQWTGLFIACFLIFYFVVFALCIVAARVDVNAFFMRETEMDADMGVEIDRIIDWEDNIYMDGAGDGGGVAEIVEILAEAVAIGEGNYGAVGGNINGGAVAAINAQMVPGNVAIYGGGDAATPAICLPPTNPNPNITDESEDAPHSFFETDSIDGDMTVRRRIP